MTRQEVIDALKKEGIDVSKVPADRLDALGKATPEELKAVASLIKKTGAGKAVPLDGGFFF
ncbi:hypothetical protein [Mesorhizobium sp. B1-1-7]|uniref:hypothetical protein n=1 Tax=Mesorhizobium sp. B1-1-7 TaxID=2589977 RepID=UPI0011274FE5|nr:hypothetical protein [Mesorhizobium sp. B1-1-7]TPN48563.1 hypothetical protein FJ978_19510 [Mesorhizobium sp. B1-1-7]